MSITVTVPTGLTLSGNPVWVTATGPEAPAGATNYKFAIKIESTGGELTGAPFYDAVPPDDALFARFNIQGYVDRQIAYSFAWPVSAPCVAYGNFTHEVEITGGVSYIDSNGDLVETWNVSGETFTLLKGGVSQRQIDIWKAAAQNFQTTYITPGKFLTQRPQDDYCHPNQPVKLWFWNDGITCDTLRLVCTYSDGSSVTENIAITQYEDYMHELNVNPYHNSIDLVLENGAKLLSWTARLYNGATTVSDIRSFQYDLRYIERPFWLLFANSLGGIDDVYLSGYAIEGFEVEGTTVYKPAQFDNTIFDRTLITPNKQGSNAWRINTGPKTATQMLHLRDLMLSREVWLLYPNNGVSNYYVIPVNIGNSQAELVDRQKDRWAMDIEITEAHNSQFSFDNRLY
jgi:hypothetical protein